MGTTSVLRDEVRASATRLGGTAEEVRAAADTVGACTFGAGAAGRFHGADGAAVRAGVEHLAGTLAAWHDATLQARDHVLTAVDHYTRVDEAATEAQRGATS